MFTPSIFGESLFDDWMDDFEKEFDKELRRAKNPLYGKHEKDEVNAQLHDGYITISAAKGLDKDEKDKKTGKYIRRERYAGSMMRSFYVGDEIKQEDIHAKFENGILQLSIPKKEAKAIAQNNYIAIE